MKAMQVASVISCLVRVYVLPVAVVGFTWETISDVSTSSMSGGSGNVNDGAGKCGWRKVTMTEPASTSIAIMQPSQPNPSYSTMMSPFMEVGCNFMHQIKCLYH